jgi:hypothetical protein
MFKKKIKSIPVVLEIDLKVRGKQDVYTMRKDTKLFIQPFPGLIIDEDSTMRRNSLRITEIKYTVEQVRCSQLYPKVLCYCEIMYFDTEKELIERRDYMKQVNWFDAGFPG